MEDNSLLQDTVFKREVDPCTQICRCCLSTDKQMKNVLEFRNCFEELAGITVSESDGLPQWLCGECCALITKAARIRWKILKAHGLLYEYSARCAPFPIDAQDVELSRYASPNLSMTLTLVLDFTVSKMGFSEVVQHEKINEREFLDLDLPAMEEAQEVVKEEGGFSDYEDITLEEYRNIEIPKIETATTCTTEMNEVDDKTIGYITEYMTENEMLAFREQEQQKVKYATSNYKCELCIIGFYTQSQVKEHFLSSHRAQPNTEACRICYVQVADAMLNAHVESHYVRHICTLCGHTDTSVEFMEHHVRTHTVLVHSNAVIKIDSTEPAIKVSAEECTYEECRSEECRYEECRYEERNHLLCI